MEFSLIPLTARALRGSLGRVRGGRRGPIAGGGRRPARPAPRRPRPARPRIRACGSRLGPRRAGGPRPRYGGRARSYFLPWPVGPEHRPEDVADLPERRLRLHGLDDRRHDVLVLASDVLKAAEMPLRRLRIPALAQLPQRSNPFRGELGVRLGDRDPLALLDEGIHADDRPLPPFELDLIAVRRIGDLQLDPTGFDRLAHAA